MSILNSQLKEYLLETTKKLADNLKQKILDSYTDETQRKLAFGLIYCFKDFFNSIHPKIEYTKLVYKFTRTIKVDYHEFDKFVILLVKTFYISFGKEYKQYYNYSKSLLWLVEHVRMGYGNLPEEFWSRPFSNEDLPVEKIGKFWYILLKWKW